MIQTRSLVSNETTTQHIEALTIYSGTNVLLQNGLLIIVNA